MTTEQIATIVVIVIDTILVQLALVAVWLLIRDIWRLP